MKALKACLVISLAFIVITGTFLAMALPAMAVGTMALNPTSGPVGSVVTVTGPSGYVAAAGSAYTVTYTYAGGATVVIGSGSVAAGGALNATVVSIPASTAGLHAITITTVNVADTVAANFTVTPQILLSPATGRTGDIVTISGSGYGASLTITITYAGTTIVTTSTDVNGSFSANITVPAGPQGSRLISAFDAYSNSASATFTTTARLTVNPTSIASGGQVTIAGSGFGSSLGVAIFIDGATTNLAATADVNGSFSLTAATPPKPSGVHTLSAQDSAFNTAQTTLTVAPSLSINPTKSAIGGLLTVAGSGFSVSSGITFQIDNVTANPTATSDSNGSFNKTGFQVPTLTGGQHTLSAIDTGGITAAATFTVTSSATVNPTAGEVNKSAQITGNGFGASKAITITLESTKLTTTPATITSTAEGSFTGSFTVPSSYGGSHTITATDGTNAAAVNFAVNAIGSITGATKGPVGTNVTATGSGFGASAPVTINYDSREITKTTASANGGVSVTFPVPASAFGNHTVTITDGTRSSLPSTFTVEPASTISPASGNIGTSVTITCTGFIASAQMVLKYDGAEQGKASADANGGVVLIFNAPVSKGGNHSVTVSDGSNTMTLAFAMDSTPPPAPALLVPANATKADQMTVFDWQAVTDPSGLTYTLQVAHDPNFTTILIQKTGLTDTGYTLTLAEKLRSTSKNQPYYWRVKATDRASNEGAWSSSWTSFIGIVLPAWLIEGVLGLLVIVAAFVGYWLGSRAGRKKRMAPSPPTT